VLIHELELWIPYGICIGLTWKGKK